MPTGSGLTLASLSTLFRKSYYSTGGRRGLQRGRGLKGLVVWDWAKKLIGLDCFLSFLIWLSFSFKSRWLDGIRHTELFCSVFCFGLFYGANLRPKFNLGNYVCLWFELKDKIKTKQTEKKLTHPLLSIEKQMNTRKKPFSLQHPGPPGGKKKWRRWWLYKLWQIWLDNTQQQTPVPREKFPNISSVLRS